MADLTCAVCGSKRVIPGVTVWDYNQVSTGPLSVSVPLKNPEATKLLGLLSAVRDKAVGTLVARICGDCGHAELYSPEAAALWKGYSGEG